MSAVTPEVPCPSCKYTMNRATAMAGDYTPSPGDVGMCLNCGELFEYDDQLRPINPVSEGKMDLIDPGEVAALKGYQAVIKLRGPIRSVTEHDPD